MRCGGGGGVGTIPGKSMCRQSDCGGPDSPPGSSVARCPYLDGRNGLPP